MKYQDGKIYKILNSESDDIYVGSTTQKLSKRMANHRAKVKSGRVLKLYEKMLEIGEEKFQIEFIEEYPCQNSEQLLKREGEWMREIGTLNENVAGRTKQEYADENRDIKTQKAKEYCQENKEQILRRQREHYEENKDRINERHKKYSEEHKEERKAYPSSQKEVKAKYNKEYYNANKEQSCHKHKEWVAKNNVKILCEICNREYPKYNRAHHIQRKYHLDALNNLDNNNISLQADDIREDGKAEA